MHGFRTDIHFFEVYMNMAHSSTWSVVNILIYIYDNLQAVFDVDQYYWLCDMLNKRYIYHCGIDGGRPGVVSDSYGRLLLVHCE